MKSTKRLAGLAIAMLCVAGTEAAAQQTQSASPPQLSSEVAATRANPIIRTMRLPPERLQDIATTLGIQYADDPEVKVSADRARGEIVILAAPAIQGRIDAQIRGLLASQVVERAGRTISTATVSRQFPLKQITWREFEDGLQMFSGERLPSTTRRNGELSSFELVDQPVGNATIEVDRRSNAVTVVAPEPAIDGWQALIQSLDMEHAHANDVMRLAKIKNAEPAPIQQAIRLLRQLKSRDARGSGSTVGVAGSDVRFMGTGFAAQQEGNADAQQPQNDAGDVPGDAPATGIDSGEEGGLFGDVQIQFVPELGVIIVRGAKRDVERVMKVIDEIEKQAQQTQPKIEVYPLQYVDSEAMAALVQQLYTDVLSSRGSNISITALVKPNALLLIGREEAIVEIKNLIAKLDTPVDASTQLRVYRLEHASAVDAETTVRNFFTQRPGVEEDDLRPGLGTRVRVISDYRTNSLIVQAAPRDMLEVTEIIRKLDVSKIPARDELKVFQLKNALAADLQPVLQEAITGQAADQPALPPNFTRPSTTLSILAVDADGNRVIDSGLLASVVVSADPNANALVVRAPSVSMPLIAELIRQLDQLPGAETVVKVFQLQNSDAGALSQALTNLFTTQNQNTAGGFGGGFGGFGGFGGTAAGVGPTLAQTTASPEGSLVPLRFSTDTRTNSVIAVGSISDLEVVESIILRLDTEGFATRRTEVIWLRNATALLVADAITEYVRQRNTATTNVIQNLQSQGGSAISVYDFADRDLIVVPEEVSNSLLISVSPRLYDTVMRVIDQLDRRPPMVMVRVILAEVSLGDGFEWGSEFGIQDSLLFDRGVAGVNSAPGFNFNGAGLPNANQAGSGSLAGQSLSTFGLGRASQQFGYGGFVLAAASDSVSLLLRALQDAQRLQILSRPMIMTKDNTRAIVQVGQTVPIVTGIAGVGGISGGQVITEPREVGLILRVLPRVGSDGLIRLEIDAERSAVSTVDGIPIGTDANGNAIISPRINRTFAQSTLTAFSGQTVVYGGLIQKNRNQSSRRIPYVSSIPVLGALFRYDIETETRSELLIIMTPIIVDGDEDLEYVKQEESSRMSYCLADIVEMNGDVGLSGGYGLWGPAVGPVIYPDMTPTIDDVEFMHGTDFAPPYGEMYEEGLDPQQGAGACPPEVEVAPPGYYDPAGQYPPGQYPPGQYQPGLNQPGLNQPGQYPPAPYPGQYQPGQYPGLNRPGQSPNQYPGQYDPAGPVGQGSPGPAAPSVPGPALPSVIDPEYPVSPTSHIRQVQHSEPGSSATRKPAPPRSPPPKRLAPVR